MLSYQHIYHAGNAADIHKHLWLITVLEYLTRKDKPIFWLDTHAGRGCYDLSSAEAQKTEEFKTALTPVTEYLNAQNDLPAPLQIYKNLITHKAAHYPGSALIAAQCLRPNDRLTACELHKGEYPYLQNALQDFANSKAIKTDGMKLLVKSAPPAERRGGVLVDPSYEIKTEYESTAEAVLKAYTKWPTGIFMVWYPVLPAARHLQLIEALKSLPHITQDEWHWKSSSINGSDRGMSGSGMLVINPPYTCTETIHSLKHIILDLLG